MKKSYLIIAGVLLFFTSSCSSQKDNLEQVRFLVGKWQVEEKNTFEEWAIQGDGSLSGESYKMIDGKKMITEKLSLKNVDNEIIYTARVINQNDGKGILFTLKTEGNTFSFENLQHDFPKKIQYKLLSENKLEIHVLGENNEGFSYYMNKVN